MARPPEDRQDGSPFVWRDAAGDIALKNGGTQTPSMQDVFYRDADGRMVCGCAFWSPRTIPGRWEIKGRPMEEFDLMSKHEFYRILNEPTERLLDDVALDGLER